MRSLFALLLFATALIGTPAGARSETQDTLIPLASGQAATVSCGKKRLKTSIDSQSRDGGNERLTITCQRFTVATGTDQPVLIDDYSLLFYCAASGERVFALYGTGTHDIKLICLNTERTLVAVPDKPATNIPLERVEHKKTGVRHLAHNKVYTVRCRPNEELVSWRIMRNGRMYHQAACEDEAGRKNRERFIACQWPTRAIPENVITPDDQDVARYVCLSPTP